MDRTAILQRILELGRNIFDEEDLDFSDETLFKDVKEWDSLNHMRMVVAMEDAFGIKFNVAQLQNLKLVADLLDIVETQRQAAGLS